MITVRSCTELFGVGKANGTTGSHRRLRQKMDRVGLEPTTHALKGHCSTN